MASPCHNACGVETGDVRVVFGESCERERDGVRSIPFVLVRVAVVLSQSYLFSIDEIQIGCDDCSSESETRKVRGGLGRVRGGHAVLVLFAGPVWTPMPDWIPSGSVTCACPRASGEAHAEEIFCFE